MKTIFITSFHPHISRNILSTDVLRLLKENLDLRIVLVVPDYKTGYFKDRFGADNVLVEGARTYMSSRRFSGFFFKRLARHFLNSGTIRNHRKYSLYWDRNFIHFILLEFVGFVGKPKTIRAIARWLDLRLSPRGFFDGLITKYKPDAVFSTEVKNEDDVALMQDARRRGIPVINMWRSWDNPTQQLLRIWPDLLLAGSSELKLETVNLQGFPEEKIRIVGIPHYDKYVFGPTKNRNAFFAQYGFNPTKKLILFAPGGDRIIQFNDTDDYALNLLLSFDVNILSRFPPGEDIESIDKKTWPANVVMDKPGFRFAARKGEFEITPEDNENLINALHFCDLVVTGPTSLPLDAALVDKPSVLVDTYPTERSIYAKGWGFLRDHIHKLRSTGGTWYVGGKDEFLKAVGSYLADPSIHAAGRAKIREKWLSYSDGKSSERMSKEILRFIGLK